MMRAAMKQRISQANDDSARALKPGEAVAKLRRSEKVASPSWLSATRAASAASAHWKPEMATECSFPKTTTSAQADSIGGPSLGSLLDRVIAWHELR
ncbi:hypothetical protein PsYK624_029510 [Phanerochaete sordida]|uniref:Uncharacterized protein n=1 Tax=Phanerochaete sordida TaxID=48140 RepID=A0A9P3G0R6_9APHY|nr:hypothetical protein PsYK624_029510 [Phanerochaete sordida]